MKLIILLLITSCGFQQTEIFKNNTDIETKLIFKSDKTLLIYQNKTFELNKLDENNEQNFSTQDINGNIEILEIDILEEKSAKSCRYTGYCFGFKLDGEYGFGLSIFCHGNKQVLQKVKKYQKVLKFKIYPEKLITFEGKTHIYSSILSSKDLTGCH